jgi:hypothetical protein
VPEAACRDYLIEKRAWDEYNAAIDKQPVAPVKELSNE